MVSKIEPGICIVGLLLTDYKGNARNFMNERCKSGDRKESSDMPKNGKLGGDGMTKTRG